MAYDKFNIIKMVKGTAVSIDTSKKIILVKLDNNKIIKSDIVVNVSGPVNLDQLNFESNLIKSIKSNTNKFEIVSSISRLIYFEKKLIKKEKGEINLKTNISIKKR